MNTKIHKNVDGLLRLTFLFFFLFFAKNGMAQTGAQPAGMDTVRAGRFDNGKMWTFDHPPIDYFQEAYGFAPDDAWFEKARLGTLRIPGCTSSFVSPNGLILTNHHCSRGYAPQISLEGENILDDGFYAASLAEERPVPGLYADQLISIADVTDEVYAALEGMETDAERAQARQDVIETIRDHVVEEAGGADADMRVEVISLYSGAQYSAYTFRRYTDVRLVLMPELQTAKFGGDPDNFTYPRYSLDFTLFRVYENDLPLSPDYYFTWSTEGSKEGDAVFVVGNPGSTSRLMTVTQLEYRRDVSDKAILHLLNERVAALLDFYELYPEKAEAMNIRPRILSFQNSQKAYQGRVDGLNDAYIMARRRDNEANIKSAIAGSPGLSAQYGDLFDRMAAIQQERNVFSPHYGAFLALQPGSALCSPIMQRALLAYTLLSQQEQGATEDLQGLTTQLLGIADQHPWLDETLLQKRFSEFVLYFGEDHDIVQQIIGDQTPEQAARHMMETSVLSTAASTAQAVEDGTLSMDDTAIAAVGVFIDAYRDYQSASAGLAAQQQEVASALGRARFEIYGTDIPPDATFSLRIADGFVQGYPYNGTLAPAYTTFYGMYDHYYSYFQNPEWLLNEHWLNYPDEFDLSTPLNMVSTNDIIGGNSGSPLLSKDLELVGLVFDGNIESLPGDFIYLTELPRTVSVDARGILEAIDVMYDADRIARELVSGELVATEAEADALVR